MTLHHSVTPFTVIRPNCWCCHRAFLHIKRRYASPHRRNVSASESRAKAQAGNKKPSAPKTVEQNEAKKVRRGPKFVEEDGPSGEHNNKKSRKNDMRSALVERNLAGGRPLTTTVTKNASPRVSASTSVGPTIPSSLPTNRPTDASGMAPSAEILLVRQARETAKKEAEAAGSGKRARAPSRRALEASGRMKDQGAQWMTREKKAEETRVKTELREQRKQCKAAGLKFGVVLEAFVGETAGTAANGADAGNGVGGGAGIGGRKGAEEGDSGADSPRINGGWQKVSPVML